MSAPNWKRAEADAAAPQLQRLDDFYHGTDAVRMRSKTYVPPLELETDVKYKARSTAAVAPGALTRTVDGSVGRIFSTAPTIEPNRYARIADEWQDLDGQGTHGDVWLSRASVWAILDGFYLALVDAPQAPAPLVSIPEAARYRPRWIGYRRSQVLNWRTAVIDGKVVLTMLALAEVASVPNGEWALVSEERVRVLRRTDLGVTAEVWAERDTAARQKAWQLIEGPVLYDGPAEIPVAILAGGKITAPFVARPPLLALCDKLIEFFRAATNMAHYEQMSCFPQPVVVGQLISQSGDGKLVLGPTSVVNVEAGGDFKWAELAGSSMAQLRENQRDRRQEIGALGLSFLVTETRSAETAKAKALDNAAENATLADAARGIEDGANMALVHHVAYANVVAADAPTVSLNKNLSGDTIDAVLLRVLLDMRAAGELTRAEFREILSRGRIIPSEMALEDAVLAAELEASLNASDVDPQPLEDAA
jgi:hypothetical protein